jgi:hypothetical protein
MTGTIHARIVAPYLHLRRALWIPRVYLPEGHLGAPREVHGPEGFECYAQAVEASQFLARRTEPRSSCCGRYKARGLR